LLLTVLLCTCISDDDFDFNARIECSTKEDQHSERETVCFYRTKYVAAKRLDSSPAKTDLIHSEVTRKERVLQIL